MDNKFYITAAIPYTSGPPHAGHTLEYIITDVVNRYWRLYGKEVMFACGSDENGQKILETAEKEGLKPLELGNKYTKAFLNHLKNLNVLVDEWRRGSDQKLHWPGVQALWKLAYKKGDIYKKTYTGLYCVGCEQFYKKEELKDGMCPEHLTVPKEVEEENYFFRLSKYEDQLRKLIESDELRVFPEIRKNETLGLIKQGLEDFSVSRPAERLKNWGVPVPGDAKQVMYVWFDALTIYMTAVGWGYDEKLWEKWWPADLHVIGKGIYRFHTVYWPAMLLSAGLPLPKAVLVHGYVTSGGQKMAKSLGNVVNPEELLKEYGSDPIRYYLLKEIPTQSDGDFTIERFKEVYNADLANGLGNLVARTEALAFRNKLDLSQLSERISSDANKRIEGFIINYRFDLALNYIWNWIHALDKYFDQEKPWEKSTDEANKIVGKIVIGTEMMSGIRQIAQTLLPFLPSTAEEIIKRFDVKIIKKVGTPLFPRL